MLLFSAKDINASAGESGELKDYILKHKVILIPGVLVVVALFVVGITWGIWLHEGKSKLILGNSEESRKNIPISSTIGIPSLNI